MGWRRIFFLLAIATIAIKQSEAQVIPDSITLDKLKEYPKKNSLPVRSPVILLDNVEIPEANINLKVNYWRTWVAFGINLNQTAFSDNWSGGGVNSLALGSTFNFKADYTKNEKNFVSEIVLQYSKLKNKDQLERKTNDRIFWDNKMSFKLAKYWSFFGSLSFESQFDEGFFYSKDKQGIESRKLISRFMAPGYFTESIGFEYKRSKTFYLRIGTGTARQTVVLDKNIYLTNPKNFGVEPGKSFRNELAFQIVANLDKEVAKNIHIKSRYAMFANYETLSRIDHRIDITLSARVNRLVNVSLSGVGLYDDDTAPKIQASQGLALGLLYKIAR